MRPLTEYISSCNIKDALFRSTYCLHMQDGITVPAYAVTKHYDVQHPNDDMETVTFVDGFGRPVQVKKDGVVTGNASDWELSFNVRIATQTMLSKVVKVVQVNNATDANIAGSVLLPTTHTKPIFLTLIPKSLN